MALVNDAATIGSPGRNLVLETAGHIYVKVNDRYYELDFRNSNSDKLVGKAVVNNIVEQPIAPEEIDLSDYITSWDLKKELKKYVTEKSWQDVKDTQKALENALIDGFTESISPITVQTMQLTVGTEQYQFEVVKSLISKEIGDYALSYDDKEDATEVYFDPCFIRHYTLDGPTAVQPTTETVDNTTKNYWRWYIKNSSNWDTAEGTKETLDLDTETYYVYFKVPYINVDASVNLADNAGSQDYGANVYFEQSSEVDSGGYILTSGGAGKYAKTGIGEIYYSTEAHEFEEVVDEATGTKWYYLLYAIITNSDGTPSISFMNGFTEILPGQVTAYLFRNASGTSYLDLNQNRFVLGTENNTLLDFNRDGRGTLYLKGAIVQDRGGNENVTTIYRDSWAINTTYCPGNIVVYIDDSKVTGSYRYTGALPENTDTYIYTMDETLDGTASSDGRTYKYLFEYERVCGVSTVPPDSDLEHWVCISKGSTSVEKAGIYYVDSDDDFTAIPVDDSDLVQADLEPWTLSIKMYEASSEIPIAACVPTIPDDIKEAVTLTETGTKGKYTVKITKGKKISGTQKITFEVTGTASDKSAIQRTFTYTISGIRNADPTTMYSLKPSVRAIKKTKDGDYIPTELYCEVFKTSPKGSGMLSSEDFEAEDLSIKTIIDSGSEADYTYKGDVKSKEITNKIQFNLYKTINGVEVLFDRETVLVVDDGVDGTYVKEVDEYYYASETSNATLPDTGTSEWVLNKIPDNYGSTRPYLWNYEITTGSDGTTLNEIRPSLICVYGRDGRGISKIVNYYLVTADTTTPGYELDIDGVPHTGNSSNDWDTNVSNTSESQDSDHPYLWNLEVIYFEEIEGMDVKKPSCTEPAIIGRYTVDGVNAPSIIISASSYIFAYPVESEKPENETITFTAFTQFVTDKTITWKYKCAGETEYSTIPSSEEDGTDANFVLSYNADYFKGTQITIRAEVDNPYTEGEVLFDELSVFKIYAEKGHTLKAVLSDPSKDILWKNGAWDYSNVDTTLNVFWDGILLTETEDYTVDISLPQGAPTAEISNKNTTSPTLYISACDSSIQAKRWVYNIVVTKNDSYKDTISWFIETDNDGYVVLNYPTTTFAESKSGWSPESITITPTSYNKDGTAYTGTYSWQYQENSAWVDLSNGTSLTINHDDSYWNEKTLTIKCTDTALNDYDIVTFTKLQDGSSPYMLELTNDSAPVNVDSDGNVIGTGALNCTAILKYGIETVDAPTYTINYDTNVCSGISINSSTGVMSFTNFTLSVDNISITVSGSVNGEVKATKEFSISKMYPGEKGKDGVATSYWLSVDPPTISIDKDGTASTYKITLNAYKQVGGESPQNWCTGYQYNDPWVQYKFSDESTWTQLSENSADKCYYHIFEDSNLSGATGITYKLYSNDWNEYNTQFVGIIRDGKDGSTPYIKNGYWYVGTTKLVKAEGSDGNTPYVQNGYWWIGTTNTGVKAEGEDAYSCFLTNPSHMFSGTSTTLVADQSDTCGVIVYKGLTQLNTDQYSISAAEPTSSGFLKSIARGTFTNNGVTAHNFTITPNSTNITKENCKTGGTVNVTITETASGSIIGYLTYQWTVAWSGDNGKAGDEGPITRVTKWISGTSYNNGSKTESDGKKYLDFVYYDKKYYQCSTPNSQTTFTLSSGSITYWTLINNFKPVATSVLIVGDGEATGWIIDEGVIKHSSGKAYMDKDGNAQFGAEKVYVWYCANPFYASKDNLTTIYTTVDYSTYSSGTSVTCYSDKTLETELSGFKVGTDDEYGGPIYRQSSSYFKEYYTYSSELSFGGGTYITSEGYLSAQNGSFTGDVTGSRIVGGEINVNDKFKVDSDGNLTASNATIVGNIKLNKDNSLIFAKGGENIFEVSNNNVVFDTPTSYTPIEGLNKKYQSGYLNGKSVNEAQNLFYSYVTQACTITFPELTITTADGGTSTNMNWGVFLKVNDTIKRLWYTGTTYSNSYSATTTTRVYPSNKSATINPGSIEVSAGSKVQLLIMYNAKINGRPTLLGGYYYSKITLSSTEAVKTVYSESRLHYQFGPNGMQLSCGNDSLIEMQPGSITIQVGNGSGGVYGIALTYGGGFQINRGSGWKAWSV